VPRVGGSTYLGGESQPIRPAFSGTWHVSQDADASLEALVKEKLPSKTTFSAVSGLSSGVFSSGRSTGVAGKGAAFGIGGSTLAGAAAEASPGSRLGLCGSDSHGASPGWPKRAMR
jgi:hypothetical protein